MNKSSNPAWLENAVGERIAIEGVCSIGRSSANRLVLADDKISRRHALLHRQGSGEYWLIDLGSINGTYVNGRRVTHPIRLEDGDEIQIAGHPYVFHQLQSNVRPRSSELPTTRITVDEVRMMECWLLVADIERSTDLSQVLSAEKLSMLIGQWFLDCKRAIERFHGQINKFLGDGFLAYWPTKRLDHVTCVAMAIEGLLELQARAQPRFRMAVHRGIVSVGHAGSSMGEENMLGREVHLVFRMERLAGELQLPSLLSEPAKTDLGTSLALSSIGPHQLSGFEGPFHFFTLTRPGVGTGDGGPVCLDASPDGKAG